MDYYNVLGIDKKASQDEIKKAYRKLAHKYHPDKQGGDEDKFKKINEAYQVLSNKEKRAQYDRFGRVFEGGQGSGPWQGAGFGGGGGSPFGEGFNWSSAGGAGFDDLGDIFETIFGGGFGGRGRTRTYQQGNDVEVAMQITLEEAFSGVDKQVQFETLKSCDTCSGKGMKPGTKMKKCEQCDGQGKVRENKTTFFGQFSQVKACPTCRGVGKVPEEPCEDCKGAGRTKGKRQTKVHIQKGVDNGQLIKVAGVGEAGMRGTTAGDLYIRINIKPHSKFRRKGPHLIYRTKVKLTDILLKKPIEIPTIEGDATKLEIPREFNIKEPLRIRGKGMPILGSGGRGDMVVELDLVVPKNLSKKAKKLLKELEKEL